MKINFDVIEARLKSLVESSANLVSGRPQEENRVSQLVIAVQAYLEKDSRTFDTDFPESLLLEVPENAMSEWQKFPFDKTLQSILQDAGQSIIAIPHVTVVLNPHLLDGEILIKDGTKITPPLDRTAAMPTLSSVEENYLGDSLPINAFIIVNGLEIVQLTQSVFNIGRKLENDLVIEDSRISRDHAQIRAVKGQYVIFDLNSTGGTFVNSVRVTQQPLFPGDVISLAGVPLVYGQDNPPLFVQTGPVEPFFDPTSLKDKK